MVQVDQRIDSDDTDRRPKWFNSPVTFHGGALSEIREYIPDFERRPFGQMSIKRDEVFRENVRLDTIVRLPFREDKAFIPVGVVSKEYTLVPHTTVLDAAINALETANIPTSKVSAELKITEYGERMGLSLYLPEEYNYNPGDGHPMALRLECLNSVDGSTRFRALMGWFRFVCSNGLIIGVTRSDIRRRHVGDLQIQDIGCVLADGLIDMVKEKKNFQGWHKAPVTVNQIASWSEETIRKTWGFKAAARTYHIACSGNDVEIAGQYKDTTPTTISVRSSIPVPGAPKKARNLYDVSQILAWLAKERRDLQEQIQWQENIPDLMKKLMSRIKLS
jgi:hypothetical protein